ncbi:MAG: hypothetical protein IJ215_00465 [Clostridia bacterium]|nr:hypothetical protein [Clostridia bacterium]
MISSKFMTISTPNVIPGMMVEEKLEEAIDNVADFIVNLPAEMKKAQKHQRIVRMRQKRRDCKHKRETLKAQRLNHEVKMFLSGKLEGISNREGKRMRMALMEQNAVLNFIEEDLDDDAGFFDENRMDYIEYMNKLEDEASNNRDYESDFAYYDCMDDYDDYWDYWDDYRDFTSDEEEEMDPERIAEEIEQAYMEYDSWNQSWEWYRNALVEALYYARLDQQKKWEESLWRAEALCYFNSPKSSQEEHERMVATMREVATY